LTSVKEARPRIAESAAGVALENDMQERIETGVLWLAITLGTFGALECAGSPAAGSAPAAHLEPPSQEAQVARGRELFARQCAVCHGPEGRGDGPAAYLLSPAPRDFGSTRFRIVSTQNGVPTDEDLVGVLRRGMPGSAMPPWEWMPDADLAALARVVRELAIQGRVADLLRYAEQEEEDLSPDEALEIATRAMIPSAQVPIPAECAGDADDLMRGRRFFLTICAQCHGAGGTGEGAAEQWNEDGTPASPRDFTAGIFKGGATHADIVRRMVVGLPGSSMPATSFDDPSLASQVSAYVRSLIKPGVQERAAQRRRTVVARRIQAELPHEPDDPAWEEAPGTWLPLMPLWWHEPRIEGCVLRAVHDGETLAVKLSWEDPSRDDDFLGQDAFTDAAALQWSGDTEPPLFSMGEVGKPVNLWQWKAGWELDLAGVRDVAALHPNTPPDQYGQPDFESLALYVTGRAAGNPMAAPIRSSSAEALTAEGFGTLAPIPGGAGADLSARASWEGGFWDLVLTRPLAASHANELGMEPGSALRFAAAVWDGAARDRNGQKAVTVWHVLELEK